MARTLLPKAGKKTKEWYAILGWYTPIYGKDTTLVSNASKNHTVTFNGLVIGRKYRLIFESSSWQSTGSPKASGATTWSVPSVGNYAFSATMYYCEGKHDFIAESDTLTVQDTGNAPTVTSFLIEL